MTEPDDMLGDLLEADSPDLSAFAPPVHWPDIRAVDARHEWRELRQWVERLTARFPHLDEHVIPRCWWRHNGHVEALQALKDHERIAYAPSSPASAGTDWHRGFALIESRLREWTAHCGCTTQHREPVQTLRAVGVDGFERWVEDDIARRRQHEIADTGI